MNNEHCFRLFRFALGLFATITCARAVNAQIPKITLEKPVLSRPIDPDSLPKHLAADTSGNVWFSYSAFTPHQLGFFGVASGAVTTFPILQPDPTGLAAGTALDDFQGLAIGPDKNLWFVFVYAKGDGSPLNSYVGRISPAGAVAVFPLPTNDACFNADCLITPGPDGNLWLTEQNNSRIARVTTQGVITEFAIPTPGAYPSGIAGGPDSNVWFTEYLGRKIGRITPNGTITEFPVPTLNAGPLGITAGSDGNLWFTEYGGNKIGRITTTGTITEFPLPVATSRPSYIVPAPDGNLYFTLFGTSQLGQVPTTGAPFAFAQTDIQPLYIAPAKGASPGSAFSLLFSGIFKADYEVREAVSNCPEMSITGPEGDFCLGAVFTDLTGDFDYLATGGAGPYSYALTPVSSSPPGLTIGGSPPSISGIATALATSSFLISATDANGCKVTASFTVRIIDCKPILVRTPPKPPTIAPR